MLKKQCLKQVLLNIFVEKKKLKKSIIKTIIIIKMTIFQINIVPFPHAILLVDESWKNVSQTLFKDIKLIIKQQKS